MLLWGLYTAVFVFAVAGSRALLLLAEAGPAARRRVQSRLRRHSESGVDAAETTGILLAGSRSSASWWVRWFGDSRGRSVELLLYRAGLKWSVSRFLGVSVVLGGVGLAASYAGAESALVAPAGAAAGLLPTVYALALKRGRMKQFETQLPEALDLICRALRAGISLEFGLRSVGDELPDPIGTEFGLVADEVSLGLDIRTALANLATRMNTSDMPFFVNAVTIQRETGGNLAEILDNLSKIIRDRIKFYGKVRALVAQANLTANLLACMPVAFAGAMLVVSPGYLDPLFAPEGRLYLYGSAVMVPIGWFACRRIASIDL
jgi:tight adherence protein B